MAEIRHVGIVGAGLAGLAAALSAAWAGMRVDVLEAQPEPALPAAHIGIAPNPQRDLVALGFGTACVRRGFPYRGAIVTDAGARHAVDLTVIALGDRLPALAGAAQRPICARSPNNSHYG